MNTDIFETEPNTIIRTGQHELLCIFHDPSINDPIRITHEPCPELDPTADPPLMGYRFDGEFVWLENPFWFGDLFHDLQIGDTQRHEP